MRLLLGQLYDMNTTRNIEKNCVGNILVPDVCLDVDALNDAARYILHKFPVLRASFFRQNGELMMHFCDPHDMSLDGIFEVRTAKRDILELRSQLINYVDEVRASISLERPPLLRYCLFDAELAKGQRLVLIFNHLVCDGISN